MLRLRSRKKETEPHKHVALIILFVASASDRGFMLDGFHKYSINSFEYQE